MAVFSFYSLCLLKVKLVAGDDTPAEFQQMRRSKQSLTTTCKITTTPDEACYFSRIKSNWEPGIQQNLNFAPSYFEQMPLFHPGYLTTCETSGPLFPRAKCWLIHKLLTMSGYIVQGDTRPKFPNWDKLSVMLSFFNFPLTRLSRRFALAFACSSQTAHCACAGRGKCFGLFSFL